VFQTHSAFPVKGFALFGEMGEILEKWGLLAGFASFEGFGIVVQVD